ncbi:MAG: Tat pathway signal protein [Kiritimatiellae bacterium]|nr:Tat pathway signal protein [Kiritimatiellia bacterium]
MAKGTDEIRAVLLHIGENMWCDWPLDPAEDAKLGEKAPHRKIRMDESIWRASVDLAVERKFNMILVDVGEAVVYPSHPELAVEGSWSPDRMRAELKRLRALGLEPIPKLNFSNTHNGWLKEYRRMVSTPEYYRVCADLIRDIAEIFDSPRFLHIGYDEETFAHQKKLNYVALRQGELWWHDFLWFVSTVEKNGMRAWSWSDYGWYHPDFVTRCPTSVLQSNGYYDEYLEGFDLDSPKLKACRAWLELYVRFDKAGFDQIPCGSNWNSTVRKERGPAVNDSMVDLVAFCRSHVSAERLKGFLMAPWVPCNTPKNLEVIREGFDIFKRSLA